MKELKTITEQFGVGLKFDIEIDREDDRIDLAVFEGNNLNAHLTGLTRDQFLGLIDFLNSVAIKYLERPF